MLEMLDGDDDGYLVLDEYKYLYQLMDLNSDTKLTKMEVGAWFQRNEFTFCKPFGSEILQALNKDQVSSFAPLFNFLDSNKDSTITQADVRPAVFMLDTDDDNHVSRAELEVATGAIIEKMCTEGSKNDREGWLLKTDPMRGSKNDFFALFDGNED